MSSEIFVSKIFNLSYFKQSSDSKFDAVCTIEYWSSVGDQKL